MKLSPAQQIVGFCNEYLAGPLTVRSDASWGHGETIVYEVSDRHGARFFVKQYLDESKMTAEVTAYERWTFALGSQAPRLVASDSPLRLTITSGLPGEIALHYKGDPTRVHRQAGTLLRRFHDAEPLEPYPSFARLKLQEFHDWAPTAGALLTGSELTLVESQVTSLAELPNPKRVPCHLDYTPRNWIVADSRVSIIDFADSGPEAWLTDLVRLTFGAWRTNRSLSEAFMQGYGVELTEEELLTVTALGALANARTVVWANTHNDPAFEQSARANLQDLLSI